MNKMAYYIVFIIVIIIVIILFCLRTFINNLLLFHPTKVNKKSLDVILEQFDGSEHVIFKTKDNMVLNGILINTKRKPSWNDTIFLYSHGNAGWMGYCAECESVNFLSNYGSVFLYDYRGYGINEGNPTEEGLYNDITGAWNYLTTKKKISTEKIILFGMSLGSAVSSKLVSKIVKQKKSLPKGLILNAPFKSITDMANEIVPSIAFLSIYELSNMNNLMNIQNAISICIFHSKDDSFIPYSQSKQLKEKTGCKLIEIYGNHNNPIYTKNAEKYMMELVG